MNEYLETLPPHLLLEVLLHYIEDGRNIFSLCSYDELERPMVKVLEEKFNFIEDKFSGQDFEWMYNFIARTFIKYPENMDSNVWKLIKTNRETLVNRHHDRNIVYRLSRFHEVIIETVKHNNLPLLIYLMKNLLIDPSEYWVVGRIGEIFKHKQQEWMIRLPMLKYLIKTAKELYQIDDRDIFSDAFTGLEQTLTKDTVVAAKSFLYRVIFNEN